MMGNENAMPMMGMMRKMMGNAEDSNPMKMCKTMMSTVEKVSEMSFYATPEIRTMFEEWAESIEDEIYQFVSDKSEINLLNIAAHFKISEKAAQFFLNHLAVRGKIKANFSAENVKKDTKEDVKTITKSNAPGCNC